MGNQSHQQSEPHGAERICIEVIRPGKKALLAFAIAATVAVQSGREAAAQVILQDEGLFVAAAAPNAYESFESLAATNTTANGFVANLPDFTLSAGPLAGGFNLPDYFGTHAIDGVNYILIEGGGETITFMFPQPIMAFGLTITDYGDFTVAPLTFSTNTGTSGIAAMGSMPDANDQFFGLIDAAPFSSITLSGINDPFSVDGVYLTVPEPSIGMLLGFGALTAVRRRR